MIFAISCNVTSPTSFNTLQMKHDTETPGAHSRVMFFIQVKGRSTRTTTRQVLSSA